jgi:hypothetical protein
MNVTAVTCDRVGCNASRNPRKPEGWFAITVVEHEPERVFTRKADLCAVHAQAFLDLCGPLPRQA